MRVNLFSVSPAPHLRRAAQMLQDARAALLEHEVAAEHHGALTWMYRERIKRLEAELSSGHPIETPASIEPRPCDAPDPQAPERGLNGPRLQPLASAV
jgi:hypothetical protein